METSDIPGRIVLHKPEGHSLRAWVRSGSPWIWLTATAVGTSIIAVLGVLIMIALKGLAHFWPADVIELDVQTSMGLQKTVGEITERETIPRSLFLEAYPTYTAEIDLVVGRILVKTGNRRVASPDFRWVFEHDIRSQTKPEEIFVLERVEWGNAYGFIEQLIADGEEEVKASPDQIQKSIERAENIRNQIKELQSSEINGINYELEQLRLERRRRETDGKSDFSDLVTSEKKLREAYNKIEKSIQALSEQINSDEVVIRIANGTNTTIKVGAILRAWQPNAMSWWDKIIHYFKSIWSFLSEDPREANTEGGVFPALFGTVLMVLLMSVFVTPFGVIAAVYLREYAKQGLIVQLIRIAVNNLAGVPSIVYGVFGLGFFVYLVGGTLDDLFYPESQPSPVFGTPGLLWASLTLALLTVPVVIVSTEEGLTRIPKTIKEGSLALGATKAETLFKVILPIASPSILTGMILAVARAAGEVAPLMLVGVVKLAPSLPVDGNFPYLHLERKFMHLGFHIYDVGFQSPNVDAARPLVFATALLLVLIIVFLNLSAITLRNHLEQRFKGIIN